MPIKLNARLSRIASYIKSGESVCDIGTDHGYLPIYLAENNASGKIIMSDVSRGSLNKAVADAKESLEDPGVVDARLGDGLDVLSPGEVDDIVIAGMGGLEILDILSWDISKTLTYRKYIFQPRRDAALLRKWLEINRFTIIDQAVVPENGRYSEIICCTTEKASNINISFYRHMSMLAVFSGDPAEMAVYEYPEGLKDPSGKGVDKAYFKAECDKLKAIKDKIKTNSKSPDDALLLFEKRIERLEYLCRKKN